jgi:branched-chain amino acid aminotransferase
MQQLTDRIRVERSTTSKPKPSESESLAFGKIFTDHMFLMDYTEGKGWHDARIVPYGPFVLDPAAMVFHYGQAVFEGMKAFRLNPEAKSASAGTINLFRPNRNARRFNQSCERLTIPAIDEQLFVEAVRMLVKLEADWVPAREGASLYVRPFVIATEPVLGVRPSYNYLFAAILSPVGSYYANGMKPVKIRVEDQYVRAVRGGLGFAKTAANYAASLKAQVEAKADDCEQVLWLDGIEQKYVEEVGSMNVFFQIGDEIVTPALSGSILEGVTRDTVTQLMTDWGLKVVERRLSIQEIADAAANGTLKEAFGTGTAAVISPIGSLSWNGQTIRINDGQIGELSQKLYDTVTGIQNGLVEDRFGWLVSCD